ncbi:SAC3 family protein A isoform X2 [Coffea arabica]|uniref:SAC3 family protein A isoform X2 n=1 Tax=Coffea arabica TaxID=13443 RepID=A0A6P6VNJ5_COFAR
MNQGGTTDTLTTLGTNSVEYPVIDPSQAHASSYYASTSSAPISWTTHGANNYPRENGTVSTSTYHHDQQAELTSRSVQDGLNGAPVVSTSTSGAVNVQHDYNSYSTYQNTDPYGYGNTGYASYYNNYQQQTSQPYQPPVGAYQNSGAPYQPLSSFQNTGSYAGSASYSSTYYNPADYQTAGGYQSGVYSNQTNYWQEGQYATYSSQYPNYTPDSTTLYSSTPSAASSQYAHHYKQWADYYNQTQTEVSCAPGTENVSASGAPSLSSVPGGYPAANSQASAPYITSWRPESTSSELPAAQSGTVNGGVHDGHWKPAPAVFQNQNLNSVQHVQMPLETSSTYESFQNQQNHAHSQGHNLVYTATHQVPQSYQSSLQTVSQIAPQLDSRRASSKLQIPTNPRIASNLGLGFPKVEKDISASTAASKPAYISVSLTKPNEKVPSEDAADSILKPGMFPKSLCGYVERALARCKGDAQMVASQAVMKEIIMKATADGTLHTRDWDTEPLFPLPNADAANQEHILFSTPISSLPKSRSPSRRSKSRWEPISEEKVADKPPAAAAREPVKYGFWNKQHYTVGKTENKVDNWSNTKFSLPEQKSSNKNSFRPAKKQRLVDGLSAADNGDESSESDKEQTLTAYYSAAVALADSPEERKRRESRSKRFEKGHGNRAEINHFRQKSAGAGAGNLYTRRASALVHSRNFEDSGTKAVEDIDWDALTVKGTSQEIEKRYLRLTSAPDPVTVRPEEVLEKALLMVQNSEKNYLYKCDQLKSIRQDLTVQHICNELTVKVYETHARLAIEVGDLPEFNQCQSQLKTLYAEGIRGCHLEFAAYNLLCVILHSNNNRDLLSVMSRLSADARKNDAVKHALAVRSAVTSGNYVLFFRLYKTAPNLSTLLMDLYVEKMRYAAVKCMSRSYRPTIPVAYISQVLGFGNASPTTEASDEKERDGVEECAEWLKAHGACLSNDNAGEMLLDTKVSMSSLYMPEPEDAVSHGDANLAVDDFLARNPV